MQALDAGTRMQDNGEMICPMNPLALNSRTEWQDSKKHHPLGAEPHQQADPNPTPSIHLSSNLTPTLSHLILLIEAAAVLLLQEQLGPMVQFLCLECEGLANDMVEEQDLTSTVRHTNAVMLSCTHTYHAQPTRAILQGNGVPPAPSYSVRGPRCGQSWQSSQLAGDHRSLRWVRLRNVHPHHGECRRSDWSGRGFLGGLTGTRSHAQ